MASRDYKSASVVTLIITQHAYHTVLTQQVVVWDQRMQRPVQQLQHHVGTVATLTLEPSATAAACTWLASGGHDGCLHVCDTRTWSLITTLHQPPPLDRSSLTRKHSFGTSSTTHNSSASSGSDAPDLTRRWEGETAGTTLLHAVTSSAAFTAVLTEGGESQTCLVACGALDKVLRVYSAADWSCIGEQACALSSVTCLAIADCS
jgi:hypothetical protein